MILYGSLNMSEGGVGCAMICCGVTASETEQPHRDSA